jgi:hypothetical protein
MYGKAPKMSSTKKTDTYKDANSAIKGAKKRGETSVTFMVAVGKPKPLPKRGQRAMTNKMTRGKK